MRRHLLSMLERTTVGKIGGDPRGAKTMVADWRMDSGRHGAPADHPPSVRLRHGLFRQDRRLVSSRRAEQKTFAIIGNGGRIDVGAQRLGECMVARHGVLFAAFFVQLRLPARTLRPEILDLHAQGRGDAREGIGEGGESARGRAVRAWFRSGGCR